MLNLSRALSHFQEAAGLSSWVAPVAFLADDVFVTKGGEYGTVLRFNGPDAECLTDEQIEHKTRVFETALALFDERLQVNQTFFKRTDARVVSKSSYHSPIVKESQLRRVKHLESRGLHSVAGYLTVLLDARGRGTSGVPFSVGKKLNLIESEAIASIELLCGKVAAFQAEIRRHVSCTKLGKQEIFAFLQQFLNFDSTVPLRSDQALDYFLANTEIHCEPGYLRVGDYWVRVFTMKDTPMQSFSNLFEALHSVPGNLIVSNEWRRMPTERALKDLKGLRQHFHQDRISWRAAAQAALLSDGKQQNEKAGDILIEESAEEHIKMLGELKKEIVNGSRSLGLFSMTVAVFDKDKRALREAESELIRVFVSKEAVLIPERYNLFHAFMSMIPGNHRLNIRQLKILNTNHADMSFVFGTDTGNIRNESLRDEYWGVYETLHKTPYYLNLHHLGTFSTLVTGKSGAGKSTLVNDLIASAQKYDPFTFIFDIGNSYRDTTARYGGGYFRLTLNDQPFTLNPFSIANTPDNIEFLFNLVRALMRTSNAQCHFTSEDDAEIWKAIRFLYTQKPHLRRLSVFAGSIPSRLAGLLERWLSGGQYGSMFDNQADSLTISRFQTFELAAMEQHPLLIGPLLMYLLYRIRQTVEDPALLGKLKLIVADEAWRFLQEPVLAKWFREAVKTVRKHNGGCIFATQGANDLGTGELLETLKESCETKLFLYNPGINEKLYADWFDMNEKEIQKIKTLEPQRQFLFTTPRESIVLTASFDAETLSEYANSPFENLEREARLNGQLIPISASVQ